MNRDELDAFFARAEDVLADWTPGTDAMVGRVPDGEDALPVRADSYYEQPVAPPVARPRAWLFEVNTPDGWRPLGELSADDLGSIFPLPGGLSEPLFPAVDNGARTMRATLEWSASVTLSRSPAVIITRVL